MRFIILAQGQITHTLWFLKRAGKRKQITRGCLINPQTRVSTSLSSPSSLAHIDILGDLDCDPGYWTTDILDTLDRPREREKARQTG